MKIRIIVLVIASICGFDFMIEQVRMEARKAGGNAIKIIRHKLLSTHTHQEQTTRNRIGPVRNRT